MTVRKAVYDALRDQDRKLSLKGVKDQFTVPYDALVVGVGAVPNTFDIPGAKENSFFLKEARDGQKIRARIHDCFEAASYPTTDDEDNSLQTRKALLTFCVVGGGPTGCEFAGTSFQTEPTITRDPKTNIQREKIGVNTPSRENGKMGGKIKTTTELPQKKTKVLNDAVFVHRASGA